MTNQEWLKEIERLEEFFSKAELPKNPVRLQGFQTINSFRVAIDSDLERAKANVGNNWFIGSILRLQGLEKYLNNPNAE